MFCILIWSKDEYEFGMRNFSRNLKLSLGVLACVNHYAVADIQSKHTKLNFSQRALTSAANPANTALVVEKDDKHVMIGGMINGTVSFEYGDLYELFEAYNKLSGDFEPSEPPPPGTPSNPIETPELIDWDKVFEEYPELEDRVDILKDKVITTTSLLALVATEGYGKAELSFEAPLLLNTELYGGILLFGASYTGYSKALGILENVEFDSDKALEELKRIPDFDEDDLASACSLWIMV